MTFHCMSISKVYVFSSANEIADCLAAEAILLGFQHYIVMLGTTVLIPSALVPQMGGGKVRHEDE